MRQKFFQFEPTHKLWIVANDRPRVRSTDGAFWRRCDAMYVAQKVPEIKRDPKLREKLKAEWPGILAWAVRGGLKWQAEGLIQPACVRKATSEWRERFDHLKIFCEEMLVLRPDQVVQASTLFSAYSQWCQAIGKLLFRQRPIALFTPGNDQSHF